MLLVAVVAIFFFTGLDGRVTVNVTGPTNQTRSGRWFRDNEPEVSVQLGYYASPDTPVYSIDSPDGKRKDKSSVPTSFADFMPDNQEDKSRYTYTKVPSSDWKGDAADFAAAPWMFPASMVDMVNAMKVDDDKPTGLLAKLAAEPIALMLATLIPLTLILMAVLPSITSFFTNGMMGQNMVTTTATGNGTRHQRSDEPAFVSTILEAIENFNTWGLNPTKTGNGTRHQNKRSDEPAIVASILEVIENFNTRGLNPTNCWQMRVCEVAKRVSGAEHKSLQSKLREVLTYVDESWLGRLGMRDLVEAVTDGKCENIRCPDQPSKYLLHDELDTKKRSVRT